MRSVLIHRLAALGVALAAAAWGSQVEAQFKLSILHNNDGESKLVDAGPGLRDFGGAAYFVELLNQTRVQALADGNNGVITLSSGDNFLAGPAFNASLESGVFYDALVLSAINYDAIILGNHDFDFGPGVLADFINYYKDIAGGAAPFLSGNIDFSGEAALQGLVDVGRIAQSKVIDLGGGQQVGIVSAITPRLSFISSPGNVVVDPDVAGAVQAQVNSLTSLGINKIVLVSHLQSVEEDKALITQISGIDIAIAGGGDDLLANPGTKILPGETIKGPYALTVQDALGNDVPIVTTAGEYRYVGRLDVEFDDLGNLTNYTQPAGTLPGGPLRVVHAGSATDLVDGDGVTADSFIQSNVVDPVQSYIQALDAQIIGNSDVALDGRRSMVRTKETNLGNLTADALLWQAQQKAGEFGLSSPTIAFQNSGGIRNNSILPAGEFSELDTFSVLPFDNFVSVLEDVPVEVLIENLENAVSRVEFVDGRFLQIAGFKIVYNPNRLGGDRLVSVTLDDGTVIFQDGVILVPGMTFDVASINFTLLGGDQFDWNGPVSGDPALVTLGVTYQQGLSNYIKDGLGGTISGPAYQPGGEGRITTAIPEPTTLALGAIGGALLLWWRRRGQSS